jgi:hypothetical protein
MHYENYCRDIYFLLITDDEMEPKELSQFRDADNLEEFIEQLRPHTDYKRLCIHLSQNIGWISWRQILHILEGISIANLHYSEQAIIKDLQLYLSYKLNIKNLL